MITLYDLKIVTNYIILTNNISYIIPMGKTGDTLVIPIK